MIHRYLAGATTPPQQFLHAAANVLNVSVSWLAFGEGSATKADELEERASHELEEHALRTATVGAPEHVMQDIRAGFDPDEDPWVPGWLDTAGPFAVAALIHAWRVKVDGYARALERESPDDKLLLDSDAGTRWQDTAITSEVGVWIGRAVRATLDGLDVDRDGMDQESRTAFILGMVQAVLAVADAPPASAAVHMAYGTPEKKAATKKKRKKKGKKKSKAHRRR
jgi:hypothetical protein